MRSERSLQWEQSWSGLLAQAGAGHGVFTRADAHSHGVSDRMLRSAVRRGMIQVLARSAFRVAGAGATWEHRLASACATLAHDARASRRSAAALHGFEGFRRGLVEVTTDQHCSVVLPGIVQHRTSRWLPEDRTVVNGVPCTDAIRTYIDLGAVLSPPRHEEVLDAAESSGKIDRAELADRLDRIRVQGRNGVGRTARILEARAGMGLNPTNSFERRFLRLVDRAGLPLPACQVPVRRPDGSVVWIDFVWIALLLGVETDGHGSHSTRSQRSNDHRRDSQLLLRGIEIVRFTWEDVERDEAAVAAALRAHIARRQRMLHEGRLQVPTDLIAAMHARRPA